MPIAQKYLLNPVRAETAMCPSDASCMFPMAVLTEVTAAVEAMSFSR